MKRALFAIGLAVLAACGSSDPPTAPHGVITGVTVIVKGSSEPLPFDPRGGRMTTVTREIEQLLGHPMVLELDTALSPELKVSLEETVLASFESVARELVRLQKDDREMFAKAQALTRIVCKYDAVAKDSDGNLNASGDVLVVTSPPDRFPLLERGVLTEAVYQAYVAELDARWGDVAPSQLAAKQHEPYFAYMTATRPGSGYLWVAARAQKGRARDALREEHVRRILALANVVEPQSPLTHKVRRFLLEHVSYASARPGLQGELAAWLNRHSSAFDETENLLLARAVFSPQSDVKLPGFDRFAWGLSIYDRWAGGRVTPGSELEKLVVCPTKRRGEAETEIKWSCSGFFASALSNPDERSAFRTAVLQRTEQDAVRLQELALMNIGRDGAQDAVAYVESIASRRALFVDGVRVLFHDNARRDDVVHALEAAAPRWWRDFPNERGLWLLVMARRHDSLHVHYADNQWTRFNAEYGGPLKKEILAGFLAEGPRAVEMVPKSWLAFAKTPDRDEQVARSIRVLLDRDRTERTSRAAPVLAGLRTRLCEEKNATGLAALRASVEGWASEHPDGRPAVSNALVDLTLSRCKKEPAKADLESPF